METFRIISLFDENTAPWLSSSIKEKLQLLGLKKSYDEYPDCLIISTDSNKFNINADSLNDYHLTRIRCCIDKKVPIYIFYKPQNDEASFYLADVIFGMHDEIVRIDGIRGSSKHLNQTVQKYKNTKYKEAGNLHISTFIERRLLLTRH